MTGASDPLRYDLVRAETLPAAARAEAAQLVAAALESDGWSPLSDEARFAIGEPPTGTLAAAVLARTQARHELVGCAVVHGRDGRWAIEYVVTPAQRASGLADALVERALSAARDLGALPAQLWVRTWSHEGPPAPVATVAPTRELLQLRVPLPVRSGRPDAPGLPAVRPFRPGVDEAAWVAVNNRAFAGHPEQGAWTVPDVERREREAWFDPADLLVHDVGDRIAAFCWTKVHRIPPAGEIYVVAVDPDFQGRGLGRALTVAGLDHLARRGLRVGMLYVDAENAAARALYGSLGFSVHHVERAYAVA